MTEQDKKILELQEELSKVKTESKMKDAVLELTTALHTVLVGEKREHSLILAQIAQFKREIARNNFSLIEGYLVDCGRVDIMLDFYKNCDFWDEALRLARTKATAEQLQKIEDDYKQFPSTQTTSGATQKGLSTKATCSSAAAKEENIGYEFQLIEAVKKIRPLYDTASSTNYKFAEYHWEKIGRALGKNPEDVKKRWNDLRSVFIQELAEVKGTGKASGWEYYQAMDWLIDYLRKGTDGNME
ncbi:unnamed protein product [Meloidogyne enterolobii]|uniref:Uncharacterized protein n=1 Tax=Meloidogyne enterolobii TaxID=390850 RepID=A0ACB1A628_MELEN